ncbi:MAG TPA: hypothetical protein PKK95_13230 [Vicinamibacterales bacterium]|nr:hypothetical protein [Acidobacteriota bacterium]HOC19230.1 hypothetical protein [Vicinamibacterales bacterium]
MTYNFDPDRWRDDQLARLELERRAGRVSEAEYQAALDEIERRYESMLARLDGTYQIPRAE